MIDFIPTMYPTIYLQIWISDKNCLLVNFYISDEKCEFLQKSSPYRIFGKKIKILEGKLISAKVISYHFWSNRARTLLTSSVYTDSSPLRAGNLSTLPQEHAFIPGQIRWFTGPSLLHFPFCLLSPCHMLFLLSDFIQGKPHFWVKAPISWTIINRVLYVAHQDEKTFPTMWNTWGLPCLVFEN